MTPSKEEKHLKDIADRVKELVSVTKASNQTIKDLSNEVRKMAVANTRLARQIERAFSFEQQEPKFHERQGLSHEAERTEFLRNSGFDEPDPIQMTPFQRGRKAYFDNSNLLKEDDTGDVEAILEVNPYTPGGELAEQWDMGYADARRSIDQANAIRETDAVTDPKNVDETHRNYPYDEEG